MKKILFYLDTFSFKQILTFLMFTSLILMVPFLWWQSGQKYTYKSKAALEPTAIPTPIIYGNLPIEQPVITKLSPFYAKVNDAVTLQGTNFGHNPPNSKLYVGSVEVMDILSWEDQSITFLVPQGAVSANMALFINSSSTNFSIPLIIYDSKTDLQLSMKAGHLGLTNLQGIGQIVVWHNQLPEPKKYEFNVPTGGNWLSIDKFASLEGVALYSLSGQLVSFFIDPLEML